MDEIEFNNASLSALAEVKWGVESCVDFVDCHDSTHCVESRNDKAFLPDSAILHSQATEEFSVWLSWFFLLRNPMGGIFEAETRLGVCEVSKISKSA